MNMSAIPFDRETPRISVSGRSRPTARFQPRRPMINPAAVGCKRVRLVEPATSLPTQSRCDQSLREIFSGRV